jgi:hypothetical protein
VVIVVKVCCKGQILGNERNKLMLHSQRNSSPNALSAGLQDMNAEITIYEVRLFMLLRMGTKFVSHPSGMTETQPVWKQGPRKISGLKWKKISGGW